MVGNLIKGPNRCYVDIWLPDTGTAIELKYLTRTGVIIQGDEEFRLRDQSTRTWGATVSAWTLPGWRES